MKEKFLALINLRVNSERKEGCLKLIDYLEKHHFFSAPASTKYHLNCYGGLAQHSYNVATMLLDMMNIEQYGNYLNTESCVITGLFHDIHKATDGFGNPNYIENILKDNKISKAKPYKVNPVLIKIRPTYKTLRIIEKFIELTPEETQAILYHDGQYEYVNKEVAGEELPLTLALHHADVWNAFIIEPNNEN